ncbi:MAG: Gfo/Idh/MocA family oxidoreductase [Clostridia bacterium]|nr:Gfo/Idh/MocA family oxidoreductase [Clostridia bacterium]
MKWCVIGAGGIADRRTIPALLQDEGSTLVAVMDRNPATAKAMGEKYGVPYFADEEEMLSTVACDAVYIGTPVFCHKAQIELAVKYRRHVFVEKPIAMNATEAKEILELCKKADIQLTVGYMMKHHSLHEKAKEIILAGGIGTPNSVRAQFTCWYPDVPGAWRQKKATGGGGAFMDLGVHCVELLEYLLDDEIDEVKALYSTRTFSYEVEDGAVIIFRTKGGVLGHVDVAFNIPDAASESKLELYGTAGYIEARGTLGQEECGKLTHLYAPQGAYDAAQSRTVSEPVTYTPEGKNLYLDQIRRFREEVASGKRDYFYAERAVQVQEVVDQIYKQ